jgi:hypothetical protein
VYLSIALKNKETGLLVTELAKMEMFGPVVILLPMSGVILTNQEPAMEC